MPSSERDLARRGYLANVSEALRRYVAAGHALRLVSERHEASLRLTVDIEEADAFHALLISLNRSME